MASKGHDFILEMVQRKMREMQYNLVSSDSHYRDLKFEMPPTILNHRPDAIGYNSADDSVCIGEAKYYGDLSSKRSHTQIRDFNNISNDKKRNIKVVFGIPFSEGEHFFKILVKNDLKLNDKTILLKIPDRLIPRKEDDNEEV